jgi:hypothetical protein
VKGKRPAEPAGRFFVGAFGVALIAVLVPIVALVVVAAILPALSS